VAINGVSGGPVLYSPDDNIFIVGSVSAYIVNRATGEALPGLAVAQDVSHLHETVSRIRTIDEARRARQQERERQRPDEPQPIVEPQPGEALPRVEPN
jgi:hypothetical protein